MVVFSAVLCPLDHCAEKMRTRCDVARAMAPQVLWWPMTYRAPHTKKFDLLFKLSSHDNMGGVGCRVIVYQRGIRMFDRTGQKSVGAPISVTNVLRVNRMPAQRHTIRNAPHIDLGVVGGNENQCQSHNLGLGLGQQRDFLRSRHDGLKREIIAGLQRSQAALFGNLGGFDIPFP
ncbi:hypothetical protein ACTMU2_13960 [Cupriavidus basilensis]